MMSRRQLISDAFANIRFRLRGASDEESEALRIRIATSLEGMRVRDLERLGVRVMQRILPRLYPQMLTIAYAHQDAGRPAYIVTAAAQDMAQVLARVMTFDGALGSALSEVRTASTRDARPGAFLYGSAKAVAIQEMAARENLDLTACYAYSDSVSDAPMLRAVGHPVVVNPDSDLEQLARRGGLGDPAPRSSRPEAGDRRPIARRRRSAVSAAAALILRATQHPHRTAAPEA